MPRTLTRELFREFLGKRAQLRWNAIHDPFGAALRWCGWRGACVCDVVHRADSDGGVWHKNPKIVEFVMDWLCERAVEGLPDSTTSEVLAKLDEFEAAEREKASPTACNARADALEGVGSLVRQMVPTGRELAKRAEKLASDTQSFVSQVGSLLTLIEGMADGNRKDAKGATDEA